MVTKLGSGLRPTLNPRSVRAVQPEDFAKPHSIYCVWELTLRCDLGCAQCGSSAGLPRATELSTAQCLDVVRQLTEIGVREVILIGGEAYLREDWPVIAKAITSAGMACGMVTGGKNFDQARIDLAVESGIRAIAVSIDGLERSHDAQRGVAGSWRSAVETCERIARSPIRLMHNTQINRLSAPELPAIASLLANLGSKARQVQLTVPMGRGSDRPGLLLQPFELLEVFPLLAWVRRERLDPAGIGLFPGDNIGYFSVYESELRLGGELGVHCQACSAGQWSIGVQADGTIKGCSALPTESYAGGSTLGEGLRAAVTSNRGISQIRERTVQDLWGFCGTCYYADVCLGGCVWTSHVLMGRSGNNPYCIHRALELEGKGLRERLVPAQMASGRAFEHGSFELLTEPLPEGTAPPSILGWSMRDVLELDWRGAGLWSKSDVVRILGHSKRGHRTGQVPLDRLGQRRQTG